ncbi:4-(cytidine 5'-diphospho)-2-C-methyl-D-erythritol kinase [Acidicapsa ligni]|uniref:4-(cytidine 5'-diphospho)-2-C-methyl-D-erythritol kinase n=1 Tax=Acidicapsa ligni TaxID=542300 RepID=UPI0021E08DDD|nr:4-(cytidine 5'-diphospho)-2-C-methyl-D-erythritol kinase [Acidicapsa ligni]
MPTAVRSHAKINLGLGIGAPRADGFHGLVTIYQTLEVHDLVTVTARRTHPEPHPEHGPRISLTSNERRVPTDNRNTAWKMTALALETLGLSAEVHIHIEKQLPIQGGMGAGSANAVAALVGLEAELKAELGPDAFPANWGAERLRIAEQVGSDVPLFLIGGTVLGLDRGQQVFPMPDLISGTEPTWCLVATPSVGVSTPQAFRDWDALCATECLTSEASEAKLKQLSRVYAAALTGEQAWAGSSGVSSVGGDLAGPQVSALVRTGIVNDFERVVFPQYPFLSEIKCALVASGTPEAALHASLSGSGSALFGLYRGHGEAEAARQRLRAAGVASLLTRTLPRQAYWQQMLET